MRVRADFDPGEQSPGMHQITAGTFHVAYTFKDKLGRTAVGSMEIETRLDDSLANIKKAIHDSIMSTNGVTKGNFAVTSWTRLQ